MIRAAVVFNLLFKEPRGDNRGLPGDDSGTARRSERL